MIAKSILSPDMESYRKPKTPDCAYDTQESIGVTQANTETPKKVRLKKKLEQTKVNVEAPSIEGPSVSLKEENQAVLDSLTMPVDSQSVTKVTPDKIGDMTLGQLFKNAVPLIVTISITTALVILVSSYTKDDNLKIVEALSPQPIREHVIKQFTTKELKGKHMLLELPSVGSLNLNPDGTGSKTFQKKLEPMDWSFKDNKICLFSSNTCADIQPLSGNLSYKGTEVGKITNVSNKEIVPNGIASVLSRNTSSITEISPVLSTIETSPVEGVSPGHNPNQNVVKPAIDIAERAAGYIAEQVAVGIFTFDGVHQNPEDSLEKYRDKFMAFGFEKTSSMFKDSGRFTTAVKDKIISKAVLAEPAYLIYQAKNTDMETWTYRLHLKIQHTNSYKQYSETQSLNVKFSPAGGVPLITEITPVSDDFREAPSNGTKIQGALPSSSNIVIMGSGNTNFLGADTPYGQITMNPSSVISMGSSGSTSVMGNTSASGQNSKFINTSGGNFIALPSEGKIIGVSNKGQEITDGVKTYVRTIHSLYSKQANYENIKSDLRLSDPEIIKWNNDIAIKNIYSPFGVPLQFDSLNNANMFSITVFNVDPESCKVALMSNMGTLNTGVHVNTLSLSAQQGDVKTPSPEQASNMCQLTQNSMQWDFM